MSTDSETTHEPDTTGHEWDGIREYNNPLPRWWLWCFYGTIIWGLGYVIAYPAWPLINGATPGVLGYSTRAEVAEDIARFAEMNRPLEEAIVAAELTEIEATPELASFARNGGAAVFRTYCSQCHGAGAAGAVGYPNLLDDDWLWGGDVENVYLSIAHGIRSETDEDTRYSEMPAFADILDDREITDVAAYVIGLNGGSGADHPGAEVYADNCADCHGADGGGDRALGAPRLSDAIWLYGGDQAAVEMTVRNSRYGMMPPWAGRLTEAQIRQVSVYVHGLGGGE